MSASAGTRLLVLLAVLVYGVLTGARQRSDRPQVDEGWHASAALNLARYGSMHTSILESKGTFWEGIDRYTFWIMPAYPVALGGWFKAVGSDLFSMRAMSALFGGMVVLATFGLVSRLMEDRGAAALSALLVATDFAMVRSGAIGRMDSMCAALGFGGIALYLMLRIGHMRAAIVSGHTLTALSVFTHPNGVMYFFGLMLIAVRDRPRVRLPDLVLGSVPYFLLLAAWSLYIANDPALFLLQFGGNASGRFSGILAPVTALQREIEGRYLAGGQTLLRAGLLLPYLIGIAGPFAIARLRQQPGVRTLLALTLSFFVYQWLFEGMKLPFYVVHLVPLYLALFGATLRCLWREQPRWRVVTIAGSALLVVLHLAGTAHTVRRGSYQNVFLPVVESIRTHARSDDLVMGSTELAFGLGFDAHLVDDLRLGFYSGKRPDVIVLDRRYKESMGLLAVSESAAFDHVRAVLDGYDRVFTLDDYEVLMVGSRMPSRHMRTHSSGVDDPAEPSPRSNPGASDVSLRLAASASRRLPGVGTQLR